jgi:hypothetical protein
MAQVVAAAAASACAGAALVSACGQGSDELPPLERNIPNPVEAGADVEAGPDVLVPELGIIADPAAPCDDELALDDADPLNAARAVEICSKASDNGWGIVSAKWTQLDGTPPPVDPELALYHLGHGLVASFGAVETEVGERMLALSSGTARQPTDPDWVATVDADGLLGGLQKQYLCEYPMGLPQAASACTGVASGDPNDSIALELELRAPEQAKGFSFRFDFHTSEWPNYICSEYNDAFVALLSPAPADHPNGNVSFDTKNNPISVNAAFVRVCDCEGGPPCLAGSKSFACDLGAEPLLGTGFETHAATGWLRTQALVTGGETITLRWAIHDSGDGQLDSTILIDDFTWLGALDGGVITEPETPK